MMDAVAEKLSCRGAYLVDLRCRVEWGGPLHVGTGQRMSAVTDAPVLLDAGGLPYLPGSSVRGVMRDWCEREAPLLGVPRDAFVRLFGPATAEAKSDDRRGRLTVCDVILDVTGTEVRDHVRLSDEWEAAARGAKFDQEVVFPEASELRLIYEGDGPQDAEILLLHAFEEGLREGVLAFGGKTGWGLGSVRGAASTWRAVHRGEANGLGVYLLSRVGGSELPSSIGTVGPPPPRPARERRVGAVVERRKLPDEPKPWSWLRLDLMLDFDGPMLVEGLYRGNGGATDAVLRAVDAVYQMDQAGKPFLAGSSLRGAIQAHARRICRTVTSSDRLGDVLFGLAKGESDDSHRGLVSIGEGRLVGEQHHVRCDHVAIDRVTGFASDKKLFNDVALASPRFNVPLLVRWHADDDEHAEAVGLLLMALRDAASGLLWVGSRVSRGYGWLKRLSVAGGALSLVEVDGERPELRRRKPMERIGADDIAFLGGVPGVRQVLDAWCAGAGRWVAS